MKKISCLLFAAIFVFSSCSKDEESGSVTLSLTGINQTLKSAENSLVADVKITDFKLSFRDVEFKLDESDLNATEVQFRGPYDVDLMNETDALSQTIGTIDIPDGTYKVLRFKLHKDMDRLETDPLYDRSLFMKGTIDGTPFEFWHDTSENFDFEYTGGIVVAGNNVEINVKFVIDQFLNSLYTIDLSKAVDLDEDGLIEINPDNEDGNSDMADKLKENIKEAADLIKI
ncbi:hypothetical protein KEM09_00390 [Carboxylicivirga mesophila]|uniref:DUF4382 domain-containing protein n=1 Tax=Carboxylicivirga mesophila TaxID=1166478 RepID=A0ABS5K489_9BACT|nr:hypothetical protein [Carboxylicivirga mesophila]MBS2209841.1 hypothetical protein [Carboxylicivirga mesophila]